ncbi:MAG TPA: translocation/assembly module TamB domain-containing protein [Abditibacteriaceae bacterium]|jgi:autotransporter translocation and assembly factor TamB
MSNRLRPSNQLQRLRRLRQRHLSRRNSPQRARHLQRTQDNGSSSLPARLSRARFSRAQVVRWLMAPVLMALLLIGGLRVVRQRLDVENVVRRSVLPELEKQFGGKVEIGRIESDYVSGVTLHDVVVGRDAALPTGALLQARVIRIQLNIIQLALHRQSADPLHALSGVQLESPQLYLERDAAGRLNWQRFLKTSQEQPSARWTGLITARDGRIVYRDATLRSANGETLLADARDVNGRVQFNGNDAMTFRLAAASTQVGASAIRVQNVTLNGEAGPDGKWASFGLNWPGAPAVLLADYLFPRRDVVAQNGTLGGSVQLAYDAALPPKAKWVAAGNLTTRDISGSAKTLRNPATNQPLLVRNISGPLAFTNTTIETDGLSLQTLDTPLRLVGRMALASVNVPRPTFDLVLQSNAAPVTRLIGLFRNVPALRRFALQTGNARASVRLAGDTRSAQVNADFTLPTFTLRQSGGTWRGSSLRAIVRTGTDARAGSAVLRAPDFSLQHPRAGNMRARVLDTALTFASSGAGQTATTRVGGTFSASGFAVRAANATSWSSTALRGTVRFAASGSKAEILANVAAPTYTLNATGTLPVFAQGEALRAQVRFAGSTTNLATGQMLANVQSAATSLKHARFGAGRTAALRGTITWMGNRNNASPLRADLNLSDFVVRPSQAMLASYDRVLNDGTVRGDSLRLLAASAGAQGGTWRGEAFFNGINAGAIRVAALSPGAAGRVRDLGQLSGSARFIGVGGASPTVQTAFRLTRATVENVALRDIRGRAAFSDGVLRLANVTAQSQASTLVAAATFDLRRGTSNFNLNAPRIALGAATINPLLRQWGVAVTGNVSGRLVVSGGSARAGGMAPTTADFDMSLPQTTVRTMGATTRTDTRGVMRDALRVAGARLRGRGILQMRDGVPNWNGQAELLASRLNVASGMAQLARVSLPQWMAGTQLRDVRLTMRGGVADTANTLVPQVAGTLSVASAQMPLPNSQRAFTWRNARAIFVAEPGALQVPRFSVRPVDVARDASNAVVPISAGEVNGHFTLRGNGLIAGQVLAQGMDAARLQRVLSDVTNSTAGVNFSRGTAFARADISGTLRDPRAAVQVRLHNAALNINNQTMPIDAVRADVQITSTNLQVLPIEEVVLWSRGGRLTASGALRRQAEYSNGKRRDVLALNLQTRLDGLRLSQVLPLAALRNLRARGAIDGLLSGDLRVAGTLDRPIVEGRAALRLAQAFGFDARELTTQLRYEGTPQGPRIQLTGLAGIAEGSQVRGEAGLDTVAGTWHARLQATGAATDRLLRATSQSAARVAATQPGAQSEDRAARLRALLDLPLRGTLSAAINVSGTTSTQSGDSGFALVPRDGTIEVATDALQWRGRDVGTLRADVALSNGIARINDLALYRAAAPVSTEVEASAGGTTPSAKPLSIVRVVGQVPLSADAPGLNTTLSIDNERLSLVREALQEIQTGLQERGVRVANFDQVVTRLRALPSNLEGSLGLQAQLSGSWSDPVVAVDLNVRNPRVGLQTLPTVSAAFTFNDGAITIRDLALRQTFPAIDDDDERETVLRIAEGGRIEPDGTISLDGEVLNANLSQLGMWLPDLREMSGRPSLRGELSLFTFQVRGTTRNPDVIGSIEAQDLLYRNYSLDRLRVTRFDIENGQLRIEPGNLTIVKGGFQSSAAWGRLPWTWGENGNSPGPRRDAPLEVHLPLETRDFGAVAGAFVPALANVDATAFHGAIDVSGTLDEPQLAGEIAMQDARFRADPASFPFGFGVTGLSGSVRFVNGNRLQVDNLRGRFVRATEVRAPATNNLPSAQRDTRAAQREARNPTAQPPRLAGEFALNGNINLDLDARNLLAPVENMAAHRYDLALTLRGGEYSTQATSGLRNVSLDMSWQTGAGAPRSAQNVRWTLSAAGRNLRNARSSAGELRSTASVTLAPNFATGADALLRSQFDGEITARALPFDIQNSARGVVNATLRLDNALPPALRPAPPAIPSEIAALVPQLSNIALARPQTTPESGGTSRSAPRGVAPRGAAPRTVAPGTSAANGGVLRISGSVNFTNTEVRGAPIGTVGYAGVLPNGPVMDMNIVLGQNVRFMSPTLRAEFVGVLDVNGTPREPNITGRVSTRDGQIRFPNAAARINEGEVTVSVTRDPVTNLIRSRADIDAVATGQVDRYRITIALQGPLDFGSESTQNLRINVTSDPPLSQDEAFAQLIGTSLRDLQVDRNGNPQGNADVDRANQVYARAIVSVLSAPLFAGIERTLEDVLGLNSITLDYRFDEPLSVQFGKAIGERVYVTYRRSLSANRPGQTPAYDLRVDYRIRGGLLLGVQTDERGRQQLTLQKTFRF